MTDRHVVRSGNSQQRPPARLLLRLLYWFLILIVCPFKRQGRLEVSIKRPPKGPEA